MIQLLYFLRLRWFIIIQSAVCIIQTLFQNLLKATQDTLDICLFECKYFTFISHIILVIIMMNIIYEHEYD